MVDSQVWVAAGCVTVLIVIFTSLAVMVMGMQKSAEKPPEPRGAAGGGRRRGALDRMQRGAERTAAGSSNDPEGDQGEEEGDEDADNDGGGDRAGRRNAKKEQKKQEKKANQNAERQGREQQNSVKSEKQQLYDQKQQEKEAERLQREEEERQAREEKEKQEQEEFNKWKEMFAVDAEGEADGDSADVSVVEQFVDFVKMRKIVNLEDLAAEFKMKTSNAINRLQELEKLGRLSGIFDDRGKFVYITAEEMADVAGWLKNKGRINRQELVAACNRFVRLNPTEEDKEKLQKEALSAAAALDEDAEAGGAAAKSDA
mmetsp:Transcript_15283/g.43712  ORF Transcript_15283/g.43712 Transcript_15283/m.43712 type:complete len:315 (-) Transcript_15283:53-997(-)